MKSKNIFPQEDRVDLLRIIKSINTLDGIWIRNCFNALVAAEEESEDRRKIIERLHNENQTLIEENAGLKAKNESLKENCSCPPSDQHGWTTVKCCNHCGKSIEKFWKLG